MASRDARLRDTRGHVAVMDPFVHMNTRLVPELRPQY
jgi:hypothetical protein